MTNLKGQHAIITGGGTGIGRAIAQLFAERGAAVTLMARNEERLKAVCDTLPKAHAIALDITDEDGVATAFKRAAERFGPAHILVNNAGIAPTASFAKTTYDNWNLVMSVNAGGIFLCTRAALEQMKQTDHGRIINIASTAGLKGYSYVSAYVASKHAVIGLTRALALELAGKPITINSICPGFTNTDIVQRSIETIINKTGRSEQDALAELVKNNPQKRLIEPDEIAALALWLCSPDARSVTGQSLSVAGGEVM